jgi:hypothetical protein
LIATYVTIGIFVAATFVAASFVPGAYVTPTYIIISIFDFIGSSDFIT